MKPLGLTLAAFGIFGAFFFFAVFDTSVYVPEAGMSVNNIGLMNTRLIGVIISLVLVLIGVALFVAGSLVQSADGSLKISSGGFSRASEFHGSTASMAERLEELEQRKAAAQKAGSEATILEQLKKNVKKG